MEEKVERKTNYDMFKTSSKAKIRRRGNDGGLKEIRGSRERSTEISRSATSTSTSTYASPRSRSRIQEDILESEEKKSTDLIEAANLVLFGGNTERREPRPSRANQTEATYREPNSNGGLSKGTYECQGL